MNLYTSGSTCPRRERCIFWNFPYDAKSLLTKAIIPVQYFANRSSLYLSFSSRWFVLHVKYVFGFQNSSNDSYKMFSQTQELNALLKLHSCDMEALAAVLRLSCSSVSFLFQWLKTVATFSHRGIISGLKISRWRYRVLDPKHPNTSMLKPTKVSFQMLIDVDQSESTEKVRIG